MNAIRMIMAGMLLLLAAAAVQAQDPLVPVRDLYESASYEAALAALDRMPGGGDAAVIEAEQYRAFCLLALGRTSEAEQAIQRIVMADPMFQLTSADTSPRILETFAAVRRRALPDVVGDLYDEGKAAYDRRQFGPAERALASAVNLIDTPEVVSRPGMDDLRRLASGFLALSRAELAAAREAAPLVARATLEEPIGTAVIVTERDSDNGPGDTAGRDASTGSPEAGTESLDAGTEGPEAGAERRGFSPGVPSNIEPVVIRQDLPPWTNAAADFHLTYSGAIVVTIDERGDVTNAEIVDSIYPVYNQDLLRYARRWKYEPALRDGRPVTSQKRVEVELRPRTPPGR